jgi:hypothetical protein
MSVGIPSGRRPFRPLGPLWPNPVFRRYARARLRPQGLGAALLITLIVAGFLFFLFRTLAIHQGRMTLADAERAPLLSLLVVQAIILFLLGTGQVAGGITAEADEGVLDYQRLSPMTPFAKVLGYLFGLPVREWVMFFSTLPFTAWGLWRGEVPAAAWGSVYLVMVFSAVLYHLTGLVAGTVVKNRRWAFLVSIVLVILLYTVIPQAAKFGLVYFKYLTLHPVLDEHLASLVPGELSGPLRLWRSLSPDVRFFGLGFSEAVFTLFSQSVLILTFLVMLWRRWRRAEAHLLSKVWATGFFAWVQVVLLGNALPVIEPGLLFPSQQFRFRRDPFWDPALEEALSMIALYGLTTLLLIVVLLVLITPRIETQIRGLQRARKLGWARIPRFSDPASSFPFVGVMAVMGAVGWVIFAREVIESDWFPGRTLPAHAGPTFALVLLAASWGSQAVLEAWGERRLFLVIVFVGVVPIMIGAILGAFGDRTLTPAMWMMAVSPLAAPGFAIQALVPTLELPEEVSRAMPLAFWFWQGVGALVAVWLIVESWRIKRNRQAAVMGGDPASGGPVAP